MIIFLFVQAIICIYWITATHESARLCFWITIFFPQSRFSMITIILFGRDFRFIYLLTMKTFDWLVRDNVTSSVWCITSSSIIGRWRWRLCLCVVLVPTFLHLMILSLGQCPDISLSRRQRYTSNIMVCWGCSSAGSYIW